jgi:hypothetical protein
MLYAEYTFILTYKYMDSFTCVPCDNLIENYYISFFFVSY